MFTPWDRLGTPWDPLGIPRDPPKDPLQGGGRIPTPEGVKGAKGVVLGVWGVKCPQKPHFPPFLCFGGGNHLNPWQFPVLPPLGARGGLWGGPGAPDQGNSS